ncbi:MAG: type III pantothenate kinase [Anaerolineae bacterium]|jgi:type III pantothenate kinase|nr:type III pantothenate kinase [Anaerolineae bacterium]
MTHSGLLAIDIGNTNIHLGLWAEGQWALSWRARTVADKMSDEYAVLVRNFLNSADVNAISGVVIGSVVPPLTAAFVELVRRYHRLEPLVVTSKINTGVKIAIDQPEQAGADRIVNAAAIMALHRCAAIVIDFGTATTFDVVTANGEYRGGAIAPGIGVAHDALVSRAARLHKVDLVPPPHAIGGNTIHAMQSGIFWGYVGLVEGLVARIRAEMTDDPVKVIATGGLAPLFKEHTTVIDEIASELTLDGLRVIYELNRA